MRVAINQPAYLPWMGYFDLIDQVDLFVVLDNVQFEKQSWQHRNRIKTAAGLQWLTVPVKYRGHFGQLIRDVQVRDPQFWRNHVRAVELAYRRAPFFKPYFAELARSLEQHANGCLCTLNLSLLQLLMEALGIKTPLVKASSLGQEGKRTELLAKICRSVGATEYLSPFGSARYLLAEQHILSRNEVSLTFQHYEPPEYRQLFPPFAAFASVIDLLFNEGPRALEIVRSGRKTRYSVLDLAGMAEAV
jgi:hypothetical protein